MFDTVVDIYCINCHKKDCVVVSCEDGVRYFSRDFCKTCNRKALKKDICFKYKIVDFIMKE